MMKRKRPSDLLADQFLEKARDLKVEIEPIRVLRARVYQIAKSNVLIRAASNLGRKKHFFGINYIHIEEVANLDNPFFAFICGHIEKTVIIPGSVIFHNVPFFSHDRNGEYKIVINDDLNLVLKGRGNRLDCSQFINAWSLLLNPPDWPEPRRTAEQSLHSVLQGRLLEIGNIRGFHTFCPDKSKKFNKRPLSDIATLDKCPELQFSEYDVLRQIDVLWFRQKGRNLIPEAAFEVELSTGTWSGVGRLATLLDYSDVNLYVISSDNRRYQQVMHSFAEFETRYRHINNEDIGDLYSAELHLKQLRHNIGL